MSEIEKKTYYCCEICDPKFEVLDKEHFKMNGWVFKTGYERRIVSDYEYREKFVEAYLNLKQKYPWISFDLAVDNEKGVVLQVSEDEEDYDVINNVSCKKWELEYTDPDTIQQITQYHHVSEKEMKWHQKTGIYFTTSRTQTTISQKDEVMAIWTMLNNADFCTAWGIESIQIQKADRHGKLIDQTKRHKKDAFATIGVIHLNAESG
jgi:hypothetical protein